MKLDFAAVSIQHWALIGLNPWQRSLIRQQFQLAANRSRDGRNGNSRTSRYTESTPFPEAQWSAADSFDDLLSDDVRQTASSVDAAPSFDVLIASRVAAIARSESPFGDSQLWHSPSTIRLLWDWTPAGRYAYRWCNANGWNGVISNPVQLRSWIAIAARQGNRRRCVTHPLLRLLLPIA